jgi:alpha-amylase
VRRLDFDADGNEEVYVTSPTAAVLVKPSDGGTLAAVDFRPSAVTVVNSMQRRAEAYHARLHAMARAAGQANGPVTSGAASIHEQVKMKEPGLEKWLQYDRWARNAFRLLVFAQHKTLEDYREIRLEEDAAVAAGGFEIVSATASEVTLRWSGPGLGVTKRFLFREGLDEAQIRCDTTLTWNGASPLEAQCGVEVIVNLLAPEEPDRRIEFAGASHALRWSGKAPSGKVRLVDEWQDVAVTVQASGAHEFWIAPIETVSESEEGFERVYQGSQILPVWTVAVAPGGVWEQSVEMAVRKAK